TTELCDRRAANRHEVTVPGLQPGSSYCYQIRASGRSLSRRDGKDEFKFQTNKPDGPFRFLAFSDFGTGSAEQLQLAQRMQDAELKPDFILAPGDLIYPHGEEENYTRFFFEPYRDLIERIAFYPSIGNHDNYTARAAPYLSVFSLPANGPAGVAEGRNYT